MSDPLGFLTDGLMREIVRREIEKGDPDVRALFVAGSHARDEALPGSDLDLYAILRDDSPARFSATEENGVLVERTAWGEATARRKIAMNPMAWATFREARVLSDDGVLASLRSAVEATAAQWRPSSEERSGCAHWLRSSVVKVKAALDVGDFERAAWVATTSSFELARGIFLINGLPIPAAGVAWRALFRLTDRPADATMRALLLGDTARSRYEAFLEAARWTIARLEP